MKTVIKIALGLLLAGAVLVGGCAVMIGAAASDPEVQKSVRQLDKSVKDLDDMSGSNDRNYKAAIKHVDLGDRRAEVIELMGKPRDKQVMRNDYGKTEFLYYGTWQISLDNNIVDSKNRY